MAIGDDIEQASQPQLAKPSDYSRHYTLRELTTTEFGWEENVIGPAQRYGHVVGEEEIKENLKIFCLDILDPVTDVFGRIPLGSVYRNPIINFRAGGSENSAHLAALAADCQPLLAAQVVAFLNRNWMQFRLDRIILEQRTRLGGSKVHWLHLQHAQRGALTRKDPLYFYSPDAKTFDKTHAEWVMGWLIQRSKKIDVAVRPARNSDGKLS